jgi:tetratricopeptide (TPR) repeat protein
MFRSIFEPEPSAKTRVAFCLARAFVALVFLFAVDLTCLAQITTSTGGTRNETSRPASPSRRRNLVPRRRTSSGVSQGSISEQSDKFVDLGDSFADKSAWNAAEAAYKEAINISSGNADAWAGLGALYNDQGRLGEALNPLSRARGLDSSNARAAYGLGYTYLKMNRNRDAVGNFKQAISAEPTFAQAYFHLAMAYLALNEKPSALTQYEKLKELNAELAQELLTEINKK